MMFGFLWLTTMSLFLFVGGWWMHGWTVAVCAVFGAVAVMWLTVRFLEDAMASVRGLGQLKAVLQTSQSVWQQIKVQRSELRVALLDIANAELNEVANTPATNPNRSKWQHALSYFSPLRRRTTHWNEVLRLHWNAHSGLMAEHERDVAQKKER